MIMEEAPSPQSVGREFVRQYYTLMNKAPQYLHRFYTNFSSFLHGGMDSHNREATMVIGQQNIFYKIQELRLNDCHAKISQVDAQSTLGNGVVVQVSGELSNNGEPMRRFTQTFVLAAQSPKKYYVHNDIFRYQDFITDEEGEIESRSENDDGETELDAGSGVIVENSNQTNNLSAAAGVAVAGQQTPQTAQQQQPLYYQNLGGGVASFQQQPQTPTTQLNGGVKHEELLSNLNATNNIINNNNVGTITNNGTVSVNNTSPLVGNQSLPIDQLSNVTANASVGTINDNAAIGNDIDVKQNDIGIQQVGDIELNDKQSEPIKEDIKPAQNEPKTYAQFFKSDNYSNVNIGRTTTQNSYASRTTTSGSAIEGRNDTAPNAQRGSNRTGGQQRERRSSNANQFSDSHQVFLGNVPHHATEEELRVIFGRFGTIVDLRIQSKASQKVPGMRAPQHYGFITYEEIESAQKCLKSGVSVHYISVFLSFFVSMF